MTADRIARLTASWRTAEAAGVLQTARDEFGDRLAAVSSFGAESAVLLHLIAQVDPQTPVLFLETGMHFPETTAHRQALTARLGLTNVRLLTPDTAEHAAEDPDDTLHQRDVDACCALRKVRPLDRALEGFDAWITGRKRFQAETRERLALFETDAASGRVKINPLANWAPHDIETYLDAEHLPRHPLVAEGYPSIGCWPCTSPVAAGEDPRAGRWRGEAKTECGIHVGADGKLVRSQPA